VRATLIHGAGDVRVEDVPDPVLKEPTDAVVRVLRACICGSDLWPYGSMPAVGRGTPERTHHGDGDRRRRRGAVGGAGGQTPWRRTHHPDGRHTDRTDLGRAFGATDVVAVRGEEVRELTGGDGTHTVLECVGLLPALRTAFGVVRAGGVVSRVGAPQYIDVPMDFGVFMRKVTLTGGVAPARAYIDELLPDILAGTIEPGRVLDRTVPLDGVPDGYRAMARREALKVLVQP
jgi:threonine dehydrogenase-like Zn-dependent dehydrogenase